MLFLRLARHSGLAEVSQFCAGAENTLFLAGAGCDHPGGVYSWRGLIARPWRSGPRRDVIWTSREVFGRSVSQLLFELPIHGVCSSPLRRDLARNNRYTSVAPKSHAPDSGATGAFGLPPFFGTAARLTRNRCFTKKWEAPVTNSAGREVL